MKDLTEFVREINSRTRKIYINKKELENIVDLIYHEVLFPICYENNCENSIYLYNNILNSLIGNLSKIMDLNSSEQVVDEFMQKLPQIQDQLYQDAQNYMLNDPAANSIEEIILAYPGFFAMAVHRLAHELYQLKVPIIPRIFSEYAHSKVGIDIHPAATIGKLCYIDHGTGIVIGETTKIGDNVKIYQGVTLGAMLVEKHLKDQKRHPTIEDNVIIYANATILGGDTIIGHDSTIGGNVWLTKSIEPYSIIYHDSKVKIKKK